MKKLFLSVTAIIMVLVSAFSLVGCSQSGSNETEVTHEEFFTAYSNTAQEFISAFEYDNVNGAAHVGKDITITIVSKSFNENISELDFKETVDGELKNEKVVVYKHELEKNVKFSLKNIDGVSFISCDVSKIEETQNVELDGNSMLITKNRELTCNLAWSMGKNSEGYYIAVTYEEIVKNTDYEDTTSSFEKYMYYESEEEYIEKVSAVLSKLHNDYTSGIFYYDSGVYFNQISKDGDKLISTDIYDHAILDEGSEYFYVDMQLYEVEEGESLLYSTQLEEVTEYHEIATEMTCMIDKSADVNVFNDFEGFEEDTLDINTIMQL
ncbi:MAG: hypothetical protein E7353_08480 [Clostridiales bacterium]|nr:hypothetical protein [Clostridiales bacterium]